MSKNTYLIKDQAKRFISILTIFIAAFIISSSKSVYADVETSLNFGLSLKKGIKKRDASIETTIPWLSHIDIKYGFTSSTSAGLRLQNYLTNEITRTSSGARQNINQFRHAARISLLISQRFHQMTQNYRGLYTGVLLAVDTLKYLKFYNDDDESSSDTGAKWQFFGGGQVGAEIGWKLTSSFFIRGELGYSLFSFQFIEGGSLSLSAPYFTLGFGLFFGLS